eukprot:GHVT01047373.1.p1 GENE.GHVT01047373.1~~GHVT01047373.1.p1  ORF type:complete len:118 (+),score=19.80 GHVT01047373.1:2165-2518(+)
MLLDMEGFGLKRRIRDLETHLVALQQEIHQERQARIHAEKKTQSIEPRAIIAELCGAQFRRMEEALDDMAAKDKGRRVDHEDTKHQLHLLGEENQQLQSQLLVMTQRIRDLEAEVGN